MEITRGTDGSMLIAFATRSEFRFKFSSICGNATSWPFFLSVVTSVRSPFFVRSLMSQVHPSDQYLGAPAPVGPQVLWDARADNLS